MMPPLPPKKQRLLDWLEDHIYTHHCVPSYEEMAEAMGYRSKNTVRVQLNDLRDLGYITWPEGSARSLQICRPRLGRVPILGTIAAGGLVETFVNEGVENYIDVTSLSYFAHRSRQQIAQHFALKVQGDSMIGAAIADGDVVILRQEFDPQAVKSGQIVAARVETQTTLKYFCQEGEQIILRPANPNYPPIPVRAESLVIEGVYVGLVRGLL